MKKCLFLLMLVLLAACGEDEYHYPSVKLEYLTGYSDSNAALQSIRTDEGEQLPVWRDGTGLSLTPDSLIRMVTNYEVTKEGATLYAAVAAVAPVPLAEDKFTDGVKTDAADVLSIWMGWDYLNIVLNIKRQDGTHLFHFIEDNVEEGAGRTDVYLRLYHDAGGDVPAYTSRAYLSVPLRQYARPDGGPTNIHFSLQTYAGTTPPLNAITIILS